MHVLECTMLIVNRKTQIQDWSGCIVLCRLKFTDTFHGYTLLRLVK